MPRNSRWPWVLVTVVFAAVSTGMAYDEGANDITAVSSRASSDYKRVRQGDGSFAPEMYVFGEGGNWAGFMKDYSIDRLSFLDVAHVIAFPLAKQHYYPSKDPAKTKLLIMVYWGTTHTPEHANESDGMVILQKAQEDVIAHSTINVAQNGQGGSGWSPISTARKGGPGFDTYLDELASAVDMVKAENHQREQADLINIRMLGYDSWLEETYADARGTALEQKRTDLYDEIEQNRYFVVLMAYDYQVLSREKKHRLLWETRFSIRQQHHEFDKELPALADYASKYFGQDSHGLIHDKIPQGQVEIGDVKSLGEVQTGK